MDSITITLLWFGFAVVMFAWEKVPLSVTAMIACIGLIVTGVLTPAQGFAGFVSGTVILFVSMFVVGGALFETGMANQIGGLITRLKFVKSERQVIFTVMVFGGLMSLFLSNTGTAAIMIPIIAGVANITGVPRGKLFIPLVFAITMGGLISLIGSPPNMIAHAALETATGTGFSFFEYGRFGIPLLIAGVIYFVTIGYRFLPNRPDSKEEIKQTDFSHIPAKRKNLSLIILLATVLGMIFQPQIGLPLHVISSIGALLLVVLGVINEQQAFKAIDLKIIFLFSGTLALGTALEITGAGYTIASAVIGLLGENPSPHVLLLAILVISGSLTQFMSSTATAALLVPVSLSIAQAIGADPRAVMVATVAGVTLSFVTPIATPPNIMVLTIGGYKFNDFVKAGLPLFLIGFVLAFILIPILFPFFPN